MSTCDEMRGAESRKDVFLYVCRPTHFKVYTCIFGVSATLYFYVKKKKILTILHNVAPFVFWRNSCDNHLGKIGVSS